MRASLSTPDKPAGERKLSALLDAGAMSALERAEGFAAARQHYFDALPIAAAVLAIEDNALRVLTSNRHFDALHGAADGIGLIERGELDEALRAFIAGDEDATEFDWRDGGAIEGRHFLVKFARIAPTERVGTRCIVSLIDRTAQVHTEKSLRLEMLNDSLTGLPNRAGFTEALETALDDAPPGVDALAVLVVDLERFSRINECIGSIAGDELIITVARRLMSALRGGDVLARLGGDEFAVMLRLLDGSEDALQVARRVQAVLSTPCRLSDLEIRVGCAIGCALMADGALDAEEMVRHAQFALKRAKASGKIEVYQPSAFTIARRRFSMETELRRAIEGDKLTLAFQPLVDLSSNRVAGFEALARWKDDDGRDVSPNEFIPVAEESGLIVPLGRWAIDAATRTLVAWDAIEGRVLPLYVGVNVSAIQIARDDVASAVASALTSTGLEGRRLTLELTESAIVNDPDRAATVMEALKALDATLAMDDFGTGYSNLAYLQRLPIDMLKIDRSFVTGMLADKDKVAIVRAILSLAQALGMKTTAEGIETFELGQTLSALGCTHGQGYYYSGPLEGDAALEFWRTYKA